MQIPFISTKDELRTHVPVGLSLELFTIAPAAGSIARNEVAALMGKDLYELLLTAYNGGALPIADARMAALLPYAQKIIANLAVAEAMDISQVQISESGVQRTEKTDEKTAYHYQKLEAQNALRRAGYQAQEDLSAYLEANLDDYPKYKASAAYKVAQQHFITSAAQFSAQYNINASGRTYRALLPLIHRAEQLQVRETLGDALFDELKAHCLAGTLTPDHKILLVYIRLAVAHLAIADAVHELSLEVTAGGVQLTQTMATGNASQEKKQPARAWLDQLNERTEGLGHKYLQQLRTYLLENASITRYPLFFNSALYPKAPQTTGPRQEKPIKKRIYGAL